ncbi:hypothetical protein BDZ89DRAFT_1050039 [Hymenopellis radicata]|nr:hypothetical protein BDZ89DRAFT_1050039 [Hymenopellis radicata]
MLLSEMLAQALVVEDCVQRQLDIIANEPSSAVVDEFRRRLNEGNAQGLMLHFNRSQGVMSGWFRPCRVLALGCLTQMGAGGLQGHPDYTPPTCIYTLNPILTNKECEMELHLRKRLPDLPGLHDFFRCPLGHSPCYYMIIPKIQPSVIIHSEEELEQELLEAEDMQQAIEDARPLSETFDPRVILLSDVNQLDDESKILGHYAFYPQGAAIARATNVLDQALIAVIQQQQSEGNPGCEDLPWTFIENFDTTLGRAIREINSCELPATSWHQIQGWTIECKAFRAQHSDINDVEEFHFRTFLKRETHLTADGDCGDLGEKGATIIQ